MPRPGRQGRTPEQWFAESRAGRGPDECWPWAGNISPTHGYGRVRIDGRLWHAHQWAHRTFIGPVPDGHHVDHECHNRSDCPGGPRCGHRPCVNPAHLVARTPHGNWARGRSPSRLNADKDRCGACGRPYDTTGKGPNGTTYRRCSACVRESNRRGRARRRAA